MTKLKALGFLCSTFFAECNIWLQIVDDYVRVLLFSLSESKYKYTTTTDGETITFEVLDTISEVIRKPDNISEVIRKPDNISELGTS